MRKVISIMMVLVLGVAVMGTSAYAECPGPKTPSATIRHGDPTPAGDDSGWGDPVEKPRLDSNSLPFVLHCIMASSNGSLCPIIDALLHYFGVGDNDESYHFDVRRNQATD